MEPGFFFVMGGGTMRHLIGFTRIKNMEELTGMIQQDPFWSKIVEFPGKWYWLPKDPHWLVVEGKNMGQREWMQNQYSSIICYCRRLH